MALSIAEVLNTKLDTIADISHTIRQQLERINPNDHFWVEAAGAILTVTENKAEAVSVYRDSRVQDKKVMRSYHGKLYQVLPRG